MSKLLLHAYVLSASFIATFKISSSSVLSELPPDEYKECFETKGCYGIPKGCIEMKKCEILVTYKAQESGDVRFTLEGSAETYDYISLGLSKNDGMMGDDSVMFCYNTGTQIYTGMAWNFNNPHYAQRMENFHYGLDTKTLENSHTQGTLSCKFTRFKKTNITIPGTYESVLFDLSFPYYLQVAKGSIDTRNKNSIGLENAKLKWHPLTGMSSNEVYLGNYKPIESTDTSKIIMAHGGLMVVAYMFFSCIGSMTARYCKKHFPADWTHLPANVNGKALWFQIHRVCMSFTWFLSMTSVILMLKYKGLAPLQFDRIKKNPHSLLGLLTVTSTFIQPILAYFRPPPDSDKRPTFNATHGIIGHTTIFLALVTIFLSTYLNLQAVFDTSIQAGYQMTQSGIVSSLLILFLIQCHLIMTVASDKKLSFGYIFAILGFIAYTIAFLFMLFNIQS
jgi:hypothetical protein